MRSLVKSLFIILLFSGCDGKLEKGHSIKQEFEYRKQLSFRRLTTSEYKPVYTEDFILADVKLDSLNPRRFYNFSGDLSGRYIEVLSMFDKKGSLVDVKDIVKELLKYQKPDGRFGDYNLKFTKDDIGGEHMALLWGNGRLLVGLMQYYKSKRDDDVLQAAKKLGDFYVKTYEASTAPEVREKLKGFGAKGIICFTQYIEGLVMLAEATGDDKYTDVAAKVYSILPPRGVQHSHGYLTTLRGVLMLYEYTKDTTHLNFVKNTFDDLINSDDYWFYGSVQEYFGGKGERDEGCSTADFVRLSLHLYRLTGDSKYLGIGENGIYNALYFNQYYTGDFGHHFWTRDGHSRPDAMHAAWWCCTMHGLRAFKDIEDNYLAVEKENQLEIELYLETTYKGENISYTMSRETRDDIDFHFIIDITKAKNDFTLILRYPDWIDEMKVIHNGEEIPVNVEDYKVNIGNVSKGDKINIDFNIRAILVKANHETVRIPNVKTSGVPVKAMYRFGPYLMGVDDYSDPVFPSEPASNQIMLTAHKYPSIKVRESDKFRNAMNQEVYELFSYKHGGFPSNYETILRPMSEQTFDKHNHLTLIFNFTPKIVSTGDEQMLEPWQPE